MWYVPCFLSSSERVTAMLLFLLMVGRGTAQWWSEPGTRAVSVSGLGQGWGWGWGWGWDWGWGQGCNLLI